MQTRVIGIDLAVTASHKAIVLDPASNEFLGRPRSFRSHPAEMDHIWEWAHQDTHEPVQVVVICEATGMAWYPVCVYFSDRGARVYRVHGRKTRDLRRVLKRHAGSDRIDSRVLAQLYAVVGKYLDPWRLPTGDQLALQRACREWDSWRSVDVAIQNRLQAYDQWAWGGLTRLIPVGALNWMRKNWYDPWRVEDAGSTALTKAWQEAYPEQAASTDWIPALVDRAAEMTTLYRLPKRVGYADLQARMQRELAMQAQIREARRELSRTHIQPVYRQLCPERHLETIYGVGADSAAIYIAFIQDIARFRSVERFRSWCGIIPASHQSGDFEAKHMPLTQAGPNLVKATLYVNANIARQWDVQFAALYYRQMVEYGKHHTQAICACASHLASRIYTLLKQQRPYELRDLDQQPITSEQSRDLCLTRYRVSPEVRRRTSVGARKQRVQKRTEQHFLEHQPT